MGKETVIRMLDQQKRSAGRKLLIGVVRWWCWAPSLSAHFSHFGILFGKSPQRQSSRISAGQRWLWRPAGISWTRPRAAPFYQRICIVENLRLPCFIQIDNSPIQRWLTI
ncbi:hypothetical protein ACU4GD_44145 [Cupriavidus basilensis]